MSLDYTSPTTSDYVSLTDASLPTAEQFTIAYWHHTTTYGDIDMHYDLGVQAGTERRWRNRVRTSGANYQMTGWDGSNPTPTLEPTYGAANTWHLIVGGWGLYGTDSPARWITRNGETTSTTTDNTNFTVTVTGTSILMLGKEHELTSGREHVGYLSGFCIWNRLLTDAEQQSLYVSSEKGVELYHVAEDAVIGYWRLDGDGNAVNGFGVDMTETGTPSWSSAENPTIVNRITRSNFAGF